jgi:hypothetical protein
MMYDVSESALDHDEVVQRILRSSFVDVSAAITAALPVLDQPHASRDRDESGRGDVARPGNAEIPRHARGDARRVTAGSCSGERLLLTITRDLFTVASGRQPFSAEVLEYVTSMLTREWTLHDCQSIRWWIVQTCVVGTLFPEFY